MTHIKRSPLHPKALVANELWVGRKVLQFNIHSGLRGEFIVASRPYQEGGSTKLDLTEVESGRTTSHTLGDLGVMPYVKNFNRANFVVDHSDRHTLPTKLVARPKRYHRLRMHREHRRPRM